jgi:hypothetical protein
VTFVKSVAQEALQKGAETVATGVVTRAAEGAADMLEPQKRKKATKKSAPKRKKVGAKKATKKTAKKLPIATIGITDVACFAARATGVLRATVALTP